MGLLITCSDLSASTKPWDIQKMITDKIFEEFFQQGDAEKNYGETPIPMYDRDVANIPEIELGFLDYVSGPTYRNIAKMLPELEPFIRGVEENRARWEALHNSGDIVEPSHLPTL